MTKRHLITLSLIILFLNHGFSQIKINGQIKDEKNNPIEFIEVQLQNKDSIIFKSEFTNTYGNFLIETEKGEYLLIAKQLGKILHSQKLDANQNLNLGVLQIIIPDNQIQEVKITSKKKLIERKVDRLVFNVENSISAIGGDAIDALKITPRVKVKNDNISMIGKNNMSVMIDDKLILLSGDELINFLKSIPSDNIKNIEVISTPPAKYDAEGNSGLINIKLKKSKLNQWNASLRSSYIQSTYPKGSFGGNFDYQKNKLSLYSNLNYVNGSNAPIETNKIYYPLGLWSEENKRRDFQNSVNGRIGADYKASEKWTIGMQYLGSFSKPKITENSLTSIYNQTNTQINSYINTLSENLVKNNNHSLNINSTVVFDTIGKKMNINLDYFEFKNDNNRIFNTLNLLSANNTNLQDIENYSTKIDFEHPIKWINLSYGGKLSFIKTQNNVDYFDTTTGIPIFDPTQSNEFNYKENIQAIYLNGTKKLNEKWETQLGIRLENTQTEGFSKTLNQKNTNNYAKLFPTFYLTYTPNETNSFSINYNKRINRPSYNRLNPFRWYNNPFSYSEGNPFLQPSFSNNIELNYTLNDNWSNSVYYSHTDNGFEQITIVDNTDNIQKTIAQNYFKTTIIGISESYTYDKLKWLSSTFSFDWNYSKSASLIPITNQNLNGSNTYFSTSNDFNLNKKLLFNISYWYNFKGTSDLDKNNAYSQLDASIKYFAFDKKLQISFNVNDILSTNRPIYISYTNNIQIDYKNYYDVRLFRLSLVYKFGNKNINVEKKEFGNQEEKERTN
ncbi:outer membrane beta-barrel family protein [Flavobacterium sp.]|uniref:outer membrane beta-barrel family protein n=1 Tax=Flavobacterium sp. TaxID=239 RepID=UPI001B60ACFE|nr:outer membrane beta-barrel family protein [Flavobacterium sp.]MBP6126968.1 TonB-dependent receptor family protein [Flavobacterium sp.]